MWFERLAGGVVDLITLADAKGKFRIISPGGEGQELDEEIGPAIASASAALDMEHVVLAGLVCCLLLLTGCFGQVSEAITPPPRVSPDSLEPCVGYSGLFPLEEGQLSDTQIAE